MAGQLLLKLTSLFRSIVTDLKTSQVRTVWSQDADASREWVGLKASPATGPSCPASTSSSRPVRTLHTYTWKVSTDPAQMTCALQHAEWLEPSANITGRTFSRQLVAHSDHLHTIDINKVLRMSCRQAEKRCTTHNATIQSFNDSGEAAQRQGGEYGRGNSKDPFQGKTENLEEFKDYKQNCKETLLGGD